MNWRRQLYSPLPVQGFSSGIIHLWVYYLFDFKHELQLENQSSLLFYVYSSDSTLLNHTAFERWWRFVAITN